jgi:prolyl 4-hydroxylase
MQQIHWLSALAIKELSESSNLFAIHNFLSKEECEKVIEYGKIEGITEQSTIVIDNRLVVSPYRNSFTACISPNDHRFPVGLYKSICDRASAISGIPASHVEDIKLVHYRQGQQYGLHHDYFTLKHPQFLGNIGERVATILVYLNDVSAENGGATVFPHYNISIQPQQGMASYWRNVTPEGAYIVETEHGGEAITNPNCEKWAMNIWIREKPYV